MQKIYRNGNALHIISLSLYSNYLYFTAKHCAADFPATTVMTTTPGMTYYIFNMIESVMFKIYRPVSSVAKRALSVQEVWGLNPGPVKSAQCRPRLATVATFLRNCVAQALSCGDGPRNSLHASA